MGSHSHRFRNTRGKQEQKFWAVYASLCLCFPFLRCFFYRRDVWFHRVCQSQFTVYISLSIGQQQDSIYAEKKLKLYVPASHQYTLCELDGFEQNEKGKTKKQKKTPNRKTTTLHAVQQILIFH